MRLIPDETARQLIWIGAVGNLQRHHQAQHEATELLKEQNRLIEQQLELQRAESARAQGLVPCEGEYVTPEECRRRLHQRGVERKEARRRALEEEQRLARIEQRKQESARAWEAARAQAREFNEQLKASQRAHEQERTAISYLEKHASEYGDWLRERIKLNYFCKQMVALVVGADGRFSPQEIEWVEGLWGHGASQWVAAMMREVSLEAIQKELAVACCPGAGAGVLERWKSKLGMGSAFERAVVFWAVAAQLQHLAEVDVITKGESRVIEKLKKSILIQDHGKKLVKIPEAELVGCFQTWKLTNYVMFLGLRVERSRYAAVERDLLRLRTSDAGGLVSHWP